MIAFEMANLRFDRAATTPAFSLSPRRVPLTLSGTVNLGTAGVAITAIALVDLRIGNRHARDMFGSG